MNKLYWEDGITRASKNIHERFHEPARKSIYGQGGEYPSYRTTKRTEHILNSWLVDKTRTIVREEDVNRLPYMTRVPSYDLVDLDDGYPLDGELMDDEMIKLVCERIWEAGKEERRQLKEKQEQEELKKKMKEEEERKKLASEQEAKANDAKDHY